MTANLSTRTDPRLVPLQRLAQGGRWRVEAMRSLSEPTLLWFTRGQGRITVAGVTRGYGANTAVFIPPNFMHGFEISPQAQGIAVFFGRNAAPPLPSEPQHLRVMDTAHQQEINQILDALQREISASKPAADRAVSAYTGLLSVWLERQTQSQTGVDTGPHAASARRLAQRYTTVLERDFRSGKSVAELAATLGVTPTHLTRVCRLTTGRSAKDLLSDRVHYEARRLLTETNLPIQEVAQSLGFTSPAYFARAFLHHTGQRPSDFRKTH